MPLLWHWNIFIISPFAQHRVHFTQPRLFSFCFVSDNPWPRRLDVNLSNVSYILQQSSSCLAILWRWQPSSRTPLHFAHITVRLPAWRRCRSFNDVRRTTFKQNTRKRKKPIEAIILIHIHLPAWRNGASHSDIFLCKMANSGLHTAFIHIWSMESFNIPLKAAREWS